MTAVLNQPPPLENNNLFEGDPALQAAVARYGSADTSRLKALGERLGSAEVRQLGTDANENPPVLHTHDRYGKRSDTVAFHPAWHELMRMSIEAGLHVSPWDRDDPDGHAQRAAAFFMSGQIEAGHWCPISMTYAVIPALRHQSDVAQVWEPRVLARSYDPAFAPAAQKSGVLFGMGMTEKQGGSDVRANTTVATPTAADGEYLITGHKWFTSAPMNDAFLILAQAPEGLTCFLLPRWRPDGTVNAIRLMRLKEKLGNRSNASSEMEFDGAWAVQVGESGQGVRTIVEMVNHTRLDCVSGSAALMRQAVAQAVHHARHRQAFGSVLIDKPLMQAVLADLIVESEAAMWLMMRLAAAYDDEGSPGLRRIGTPIAKYWICKRTPVVVGEALECLGGNGYVEDSTMPRLYRESPLNSIWEGSGNVICLDVLRAAAREPEAVEELFTEIDAGRGHSALLDTAIDEAKARLLSADEAGARLVVEMLATTWQAAILAQEAPSAVAESFIEAKLRDRRHTLGASHTLVTNGVLERAPA